MSQYSADENYIFYSYSCKRLGLRPTTPKRFAFLMTAHDWGLSEPSSGLSNQRFRKRWDSVRQVAKLVETGRAALTAGTVPQIRPGIPLDDRPELGGLPPRNEPPPDAAPGVREPRRPISPALLGSGGRMIPKTDADREPRWAIV